MTSLRGSAVGLFGLLLLVGEARAAHSTTAGPPATPSKVQLFALNTRETLRLGLDRKGHFDGVFMKSFRRFLRCHHTGRTHPMSERLARLLYETSRHFNWRRLLVVAGYRAPTVAREKGNPKSPHTSGLACDFRVEGVTNETVRDYLRNTFAKVGVGYYPNSDFVHLDVRPKRSAYWVDYSAPGKPAQYLKSAADEDDEDLTEEVAADKGAVPPAESENSGAKTPSAATAQ
jgi:uncharacterized protein YcbK (DUF882 family)